MKNLRIDRKLDENLNSEITSITFTPDKDNPLDDAIYYLICAQDKLQNPNEIERMLGVTRIELALEKIKKVIKILNEKGNQDEQEE